MICNVLVNPAPARSSFYLDTMECTIGESQVKHFATTAVLECGSTQTPAPPLPSKSGSKSKSESCKYRKGVNTQRRNRVTKKSK
jgi:hypothetical protein